MKKTVSYYKEMGASITHYIFEKDNFIRIEYHNEKSNFIREKLSKKELEQMIENNMVELSETINDMGNDIMKVYDFL